MASVAYPTVYAALLTVAGTACSSTVRVVDGYDLSEDAGDVVMIGVPSLSDIQSISAGNFSQEQQGHGAAGVISETGTINGVAMAWNGNSDSATARTTATGYIALLGAAIRANRSLSVTSFDLVTQFGSGDIAEDKVDGATCAISFTVNYTALMGA